MKKIIVFKLQHEYLVENFVFLPVIIFDNNGFHIKSNSRNYIYIFF